MSEEKLAAKMESFDKEIQDRAYQLLRRMPQDKGIVKQGEVFIIAYTFSGTNMNDSIA